MTNPSYVPHLLGITLDSNGVATSIVVAKNLMTGERLSLATDANKVVIFDAANFTSGYNADDIISFENCGASLGGTTITINSETGGFQEATITCAAASTSAVNL